MSETVQEKKKWYKQWYGILLIVVVFIIGIDSISKNTEQITPTPLTPIQKNSNQGVDLNKPTEVKTTTSSETTKTPLTSKVQLPKTSTITPTQDTKTEREKAIEIIKANASAKWETDYQMVNFTVKNQTAAYDWTAKQTQHLDIMARAKTKWQNDYEMIKFTYENQVAAYNWIMNQTAYPDIMTQAKKKWGGDYEMVKFEYENQVAAYEAQQ